MPDVGASRSWGEDERSRDLLVADRGAGNPEQELTRVFSPVSQVPREPHATGRGLGLGLYIAREIVTDHGGTIGVESSPGRGSRFLVRLPLQQTQTDR